MRYFALLIVLSLFLFANVSASVVITEIMYNPDICDDDFCEWIEIYNPTEEEIDLTGWKLCDKELLPGYIDRSDGQVYEDFGLTLLPSQYAIITDGGSGTDVYTYFDIDLTSLAVHVGANSLCGRLVNTNHTVVINDSQGNVIDSVFYSNSMGANGDGNSLQKSDSSWFSCFPTAGFDNCLLEEETTTTTTTSTTTTTTLMETTTTGAPSVGGGGGATPVTTTTTTLITTTTQKPTTTKQKVTTTTTQQTTTTVIEESQPITGKTVSLWDIILGRVLDFFRSLFPWLRG